MKNKIFSIIVIFFTNYFFLSYANSQEQFSFDVTEIEILENGNKIIGSKRGEILTNDGIVIKADTFTYKKNENILNAKGKVIIKTDSQDYLNFIKEEINNSKFKIWKKNEELMLPLSKFQKNYNKIYAIVINKN